METIRLILELPAGLATAITGLLESLNVVAKKEIENVDVFDAGDGEPLPLDADEVVAYCQENNLVVDGVKFYNHYSKNNWINKNGKRIDNWKTLIQLWDKQDRKKNGSSDPLQGSYDMMRDWANK